MPPRVVLPRSVSHASCVLSTVTSLENSECMPVKLDRMSTPYQRPGVTCVIKLPSASTLTAPVTCIPHSSRMQRGLDFTGPPPHSPGIQMILRRSRIPFPLTHTAVQIAVQTNSWRCIFHAAEDRPRRQPQGKAGLRHADTRHSHGHEAPFIHMTSPFP